MTTTASWVPSTVMLGQPSHMALRRQLPFPTVSSVILTCEPYVHSIGRLKLLAL